MELLSPLMDGFVFAIVQMFRVTWPFWLGAAIWSFMKAR